MQGYGSAFFIEDPEPAFSKNLDRIQIQDQEAEIRNLKLGFSRSASRTILVRSGRETSKGRKLLQRANVFRLTVQDCTLSFIYLF
jgi:hypothetical protein